MNQELIDMAREVGLWPAVTDNFSKELEAFAALVAAAEREACIRVCMEANVQAMDFTGGTYVGGYFANAIKQRGETK